MQKQIITLGLVLLLTGSLAVHAQYNLSSFNYCGYLCGSSTLYVTGLELEGNRINESAVDLKWKTRTEINSRYFELERSFGDSTGFTVVATLPAAGNSSVTLQYKVTDPNNFAGVSYYRVKETGQDSRYLLSNTIAVKGTDTKAGVMIYPNPGRNNEAVASISGFKSAEAIVLQVTDMAGKLMGAKTILYNNGLLVKLNSLGYLSPGSYILTVTGKTGKSNYRFIIVN